MHNSRQKLMSDFGHKHLHISGGKRSVFCCWTVYYSAQDEQSTDEMEIKWNGKMQSVKMKKRSIVVVKCNFFFLFFITKDSCSKLNVNKSMLLYILSPFKLLSHPTEKQMAKKFVRLCLCVQVCTSEL